MKCQTPYCRGIATKAGHSPYCAKCRTRKFKEKFPIKESFNNLRKRARQRGHEFGLTFDEYLEFCRVTGYDKLKGKHKYSLSIDRIESSKGYYKNNIRAVTLSMNSKLQWANIPDYLREEIRAAESRTQ